MHSTIQVEKALLQRLEGLKRKFKVRSYNKVLEMLVGKEEKTPKNMFGAHPKMKSFTQRDEADFDEL